MSRNRREAALNGAGAGLADVVRTQMFLISAADAEAVGAVHGQIFAGMPLRPPMVVVAGLLDERWKLEIEAEAVVS
ncbi:MAG: Rid family hydrolase [Pseudonocardiaceae bacterium]